MPLRASGEHTRQQKIKSFRRDTKKICFHIPMMTTGAGICACGAHARARSRACSPPAWCVVCGRVCDVTCLSGVYGRVCVGLVCVLFKSECSLAPSLTHAHTHKHTHTSTSKQKHTHTHTNTNTNTQTQTHIHTRTLTTSRYEHQAKNALSATECESCAAAHKYSSTCKKGGGLV